MKTDVYKITEDLEEKGWLYDDTGVYVPYTHKNKEFYDHRDVYLKIKKHSEINNHLVYIFGKMEDGLFYPALSYISPNLINDKDKKLNKEEARYAYMALGWNFSEEELNKIMQEKAQDNLISFDAFSNYLFDRSKDAEIEEEIMETFAEMDKDGDGKINAKDLKYLLYSIGEKFEDEEINEIIRETSSTNDGYFSYKDMVRLILQK